jgi:hypothetical protein
MNKGARVILLKGFTTCDNCTCNHTFKETAKPGEKGTVTSTQNPSTLRLNDNRINIEFDNKTIIGNNNTPTQWICPAHLKIITIYDLMKDKIDES